MIHAAAAPEKQAERIAGEPPPGLFPAREDLLRLLAVLSIAAAAATVCSLLNRRPQPFCDSLQSLDASDYDYGYDSCEPCPQNWRCVDGELECIQGFKRHGRTCVEDGLLSQTANKISSLSCYSGGFAFSMPVPYVANLPKSCFRCMASQICLTSYYQRILLA